jgi:signal transduction histidine kinase
MSIDNKKGQLISVIRGNNSKTNGASKLAINKTVKNDPAATSSAMLNIIDDLNIENSELEQAMSKLWKLNKMEETILNLGHELRSPLVPVKSQLELLLDGDFGSISPEQKKSLEMILRNIERLNHLIGNVTDITKIESDSISLVYEPMSLKKAILEQVRLLKLKSQEKRITIVVRLFKLPIISADRQRMSEVITNLLDNAIKFTPPKGKIIIEAEKVKKNVLVQVIDSGIGINKKNLRLLFVRFFQVDSSISRRYEGTGLGLSICKGIIEAHGGKIYANSKGFGSGSTFGFTLPISRADKAINMTLRAN